MRVTVPTVRVLSLALMATAAVATTSGCSRFHKSVRGDYLLSAEQRPLEVPQDLNLPDTSGAMKVPVLASNVQGPVATGGQAASASAASGFSVAGNRETVFGQVGDALGQIPGVTIASRALLLGSFDVSYEGNNFLVRVSTADAGSYVSAVDPRGLPATAEAPIKLIAALKAKLGAH